MATLSKHNEIGRIEFCTSTKAYCADGKILINYGQGWKVHGSCKPGFKPVDAYNNAVKRHEEKLRANPALSAYRTALLSACGLNKRWMVHTAIQCMPDDPDGVWSTLADDYDSWELDLDDCVKLCRLYLAMADKTD